MSEEFYLRAVIVAWYPERGFGLLRILKDPTDRNSATREMPSYMWHLKNSGLKKDHIYLGLVVDFELEEVRGRIQAVRLVPIEEILISSEEI
jgi:hypothetical protein